MPADIRYSDQRQARSSIDTGRGVLRTANDPTRTQMATGRGTFVNWQEDLGISTTEPAAQKIRKDEAEFRSKVSEQQGKINAAKGQLQGAWGQLSDDEKRLAQASGSFPGADEVVGNAWGQYKDTLVPIRVTEFETIRNKEGDYSSGSDWIDRDLGTSTYYFPKELASALLAKEGFKGTANDQGGVDIRGLPGTASKLNNIFSSQQAILESGYKEKVANEYNNQLDAAQSNINAQAGQLAGIRGQLSEAQGNVDYAQAQLDAILNKRAAEWAELRGKQSNKINKMNEIFSQLDIKKDGEE